MDASANAKLVVRQARTGDIDPIIEMMKRAYPTMPVYLPGNIHGQIAAFPEGQFVAVYDDKVVGYAATFRIDEAAALSPHTWSEITGNGYASRHDLKGDWLYAMEVCVDPSWRGKRVGQRLYDARKRLAEDLELKGIVFGGRLPGLSRRLRQIRARRRPIWRRVKARKVRDPVASFQMRNGFEPIGLLPNYLPSDRESLGYAAHMIWRNPYVDQTTQTQPTLDAPARVGARRLRAVPAAAGRALR